VTRFLATAALFVGLSAGCAGGEDARPGVDRLCEPGIGQAPCGPGAETGVEYRYRLLTHCGIEWAYLDGRYWVPARRVDVPSDWSPIQRGTATLAGDAEATFESDGTDVRFVPAPPSYRPPPCA
jgi:hypothetical protein